MFTILIRRRFIDNNQLSYFLRRKHIAPLLHNITFFLLFLSIYMEVTFPVSDTTMIYGMVLIVVITALCILFRSFMVEGTLKNTFFTMKGSRIRIDVRRNFFPVIHSRGDIERFAERFALQILSLQAIPCTEVVFQSHLIQRRMCKILSNTFDRHQINYSVKLQPTSIVEKITLNLVYGGKARYRILSICKHKNNFKVHQYGSRFLIKF